MNAYRIGMLAAVMLTALVLSSLPAAAADEAFKAGAAMRVITPEPLLPVSGGMGKPHPVTSKTGDLTARALVLEKGGVRTAIVGVDNLGWPMLLGDKSRAKIKGIAPENIIIGCTHTHSAPDAYGFPDETGATGADPKYLEWACDQIADAVNEAVSKLEPAAGRTGGGTALRTGDPPRRQPGWVLGRLHGPGYGAGVCQHAPCRPVFHPLCLGRHDPD